MNLPPGAYSNYFDFAVLGVITAAWLQYIPSIAAVLAIAWYCILIWESATVRQLTGRMEKTTTYIVKETHPDQEP